MIRISSNFDSGNIQVVDAQSADDIKLSIVPDNEANFFQWFYFRLQGCKKQPCRLQILNASRAAFPDGWSGYQALASYDRENWFRVSTDYDGTQLVISHTPDYDSVYYAYFVPYSYERHLDLIARTQGMKHCRLLDLGESVEGRAIELLRMTNDQARDNKRNIWITARQHPGESMAECFMEGLLSRLGRIHDPLIESLLEKVVFYLVPNMNPDGTLHGHLRTNALGVNLNREWHEPNMERSPEVYFVLEAMKATGVDLFLDIHGDETLPYIFMLGCQANSNYSERLGSLEAQFKQAFLAASPEFQVEEGYELGRFGTETLKLASNQVGHRFDCLALTLEMPFKDNANLPDLTKGWSAERSNQLGQAILDPIHAVLGQLR